MVNHHGDRRKQRGKKLAKDNAVIYEFGFSYTLPHTAAPPYTEHSRSTEKLESNPAGKETNQSKRKARSISSAVPEKTQANTEDEDGEEPASKKRKTTAAPISLDDSDKKHSSPEVATNGTGHVEMLQQRVSAGGEAAKLHKRVDLLTKQIAVYKNVRTKDKKSIDQLKKEKKGDYDSLCKRIEDVKVILNSIDEDEIETAAKIDTLTKANDLLQTTVDGDKAKIAKLEAELQKIKAGVKAAFD